MSKLEGIKGSLESHDSFEIVAEVREGRDMMRAEHVHLFLAPTNGAFALQEIKGQFARVQHILEANDCGDKTLYGGEPTRHKGRIDLGSMHVDERIDHEPGVPYRYDRNLSRRISVQLWPNHEYALTAAQSHGTSKLPPQIQSKRLIWLRFLRWLGKSITYFGTEPQKA